MQEILYFGVYQYEMCLCLTALFCKWIVVLQSQTLI